MSTIERLLALGFRRVGCWARSGDTLRCSLEPGTGPIAEALYAFVSGARVLYVGKTTKSLLTRMKGYERPGPSQSTNRECNRRIGALLQRGRPVEVYGLIDAAPLFYRDVRLSLAGALEEPLIREIAPPWN